MDAPSQQQMSGRRDDEPRRGQARLRILREGGTHLLDRLNVIYKYRRVAISAFLLIVLGSLLRTFSTTPLYRAQARLLIEMEDERTAALAGAMNSAASPYWQDPQVFNQTQYRIMTGREVARRVVRRLDLKRVPEFSGSGPSPTTLKQALSTLTTRASSLFSRPAAPAPDPTTSPVTEAALVDALLSRVSVDPVPNSRLVDIGFVSADPGFAVLAVNTVAEEYVQQNLEVRRQDTLASLDWVTQEIAKQQQKVEAGERAMAEYREVQNALSLEERQNIVVARLNQLNDAVTKARTTRLQKEALYNQIADLRADVAPDTIPAILQNPYIQSIKNRLAELQREKATLLERYGDKYPDVLKVSASLEDTSVQLQTELAKAIEAIRNDYQSAVAEERSLSAALEEQKAAAIDLDRKSVDYTVLSREAHSNRLVYEALLQRQNELQVMANSRGNNVRLTDRAERPGGPFVPTPGRDLLLATVAGLALSLGLVFFLDYLDDTIKNPDDVTDRLKIPLLGMAPKVIGHKQLVLSQPVPSEFAEAFRSLRTSLSFSCRSQPTRLIMVTSAQPLEGKTTTACNLALALAINGARVLIVDADMRRPGVHHLFAIDNRTGLSHVLSGQVAMDDALVALETPRVWVMTAGLPPPNPSELLGSDQMRALLEKTRDGRFDWVVVDTPPVLPVTDGVVLSPYVDGIAVIIGSEMTQGHQVARAVDSLAASGSHLLGAILNRVDLDRNRYYYARYYGYGTRHYYFDPPAA